MPSILNPERLFIYIIFISLPLLFGSLAAILYPVLGFSFFIIVSFDFTFKLSKKIVIRELIAMIAILQWIIAPMLSYWFQSPYSSYSMVITRIDYFEYVFPGTLAFVFALYMPLKNSSDKILKDDKNRFITIQTNHKTGIGLIVIGFLSAYITPFVPTSLLFVIFLLTNLRFVGLYYILFSKIKGKFYWVLAILGFQLIGSITSSMYHNLFLWLVFFFIIISYFKKFSMQKNVIYLTSFVIFIFLIQSVKLDYRTQKNQFDIASPVKTFISLIEEKISNFELLFSASNFDYQITRINQGWIIARIMNYVPNNEPFAKGTTIIAAIESALFPRLVLKSKVQSGGQDYFELYTGRKLSGASMDLSSIGEAYVNFNVYGGIIFMFLWGLLFNVILRYIIKKAFIYPALILWLPFLFLQVVKAETDIATALNHFTKAALITWVFFSPTIRTFFGITIIRKKQIEPI